MDGQLGLRERKKLRTRQVISDTATRLFIARGFDNVPVAEVAEAADVSVNTVFNYFRTKEDLLFDRQEEATDMFARAVRERANGESAVVAVRRRHLDGLADGDPLSGLHEGAAAFARVVDESPTLRSRMLEMLAQADESLARTLAHESGADPDDITPRIVANQIGGVSRTLHLEALRRLAAGETSDAIRPEIMAAARRAYDLVESGVGDYCVKRE